MKKLIFTLAAAALMTGGIFAQRETVTVMKTNGEVIRFSAEDLDKIVFSMEDEVSGETEAVDLGLSVKWASCNLGATKPEGFGNYYAWGETAPKAVYNLSTYELYDEEWGYTPLGSEISGSIYDAARKNLGNDWRMPRLEEWQELCVQCTWTWTAINGINGYKVVGPNGNSIFLPAAGRLYDNDTDVQNGRENISGFYWESTVSENDGINYRCHRVSFESSGHYYDGGDVPYIGMSVRPVQGVIADTDPEPEPGPMNMVDLGLSVKWGGHNVGAASESEVGNYYTWGVNRVQESYGDAAYKYFEGDDIYTDLGSDIAGTQYDVCTVRWGEGWRMPTRADFQELIDNCTWTYKNKGGRYGWEVTGPNGNTIFLPMAGYKGVEGLMQSTSGDFLGFVGMYTTSEEKPTTMYPSPHSRYILRLTKDKHTVDDTYKSIGILVRPVHD